MTHKIIKYSNLFLNKNKEGYYFCIKCPERFEKFEINKEGYCFDCSLDMRRYYRAEDERMEREERERA